MVSRDPTLTLVGLAAAVAVGAVTRHLTAAVAILVASFFFDGYLTGGVGLLTVTKAIGAIAIMAWFLDWAVHARRVRWVPHLWPLLAFAVWLVPSLAVVHDQQLGLVVASRYLMFFAFFFLVVQTVDGDYDRATKVVDVTVAAAAVAAVLGLVPFVLGWVDRASGPLSDANDFAFLLASVLPLALHRFATSSTRAARVWFGLAATALGLTTLATFSRGALVALAVGLAWALVTRRIKLVTGLATIAALVVVGLAGYLYDPEAVDAALERKQAVAQANVDTRTEAWRVALDQFRAEPLTGVGPGNFTVRFDEFALPDPDVGVITTHNAYLNILAELGAPGLVAFLAYLGVSWYYLRQREPDDAEVDGLRSALAAGFLVAAVGAFFLTEQFYAPLWLLGALGAVPPRRSSNGARSTAGAAVDARP